MLVYGAGKRQNVGPVLVQPPSRKREKSDEKTRKFTKKPHLWTGVENKPTMLFLFDLRRKFGGAGRDRTGA
jgi:hypothetical protein